MFEFVICSKSTTMKIRMVPKLIFNSSIRCFIDEPKRVQVQPMPIMLNQKQLPTSIESLIKSEMVFNSQLSKRYI